MRIQSAASIRTAAKAFEASGHSWERIRRASVRIGGVWVFSLQGLSK